MSGVSDVAFRRLAGRFGASFVVTEMVASHGLVARSAEATLRAEGAGIHPHVVQLVGRAPGSMGEAARIAEASGAAVIDINFGCPAKKVVGGLGGSALMREPELARRIVAGVASAVAIPVTVKMRLGWDEGLRNAAQLAATLAEVGATAFTVHGRTRRQFYEGRADWVAIAEVVDAVAVPVVANGDVDGPDAALACLARSRAAGVMVGRAAMGQPWLVGRIAAALGAPAPPQPTLAERAAAAVEHYEELLRRYGLEIGIRHARKHLAAYAERAAEAGYGLAGDERRELVRTTSPAAAISLLLRLYATPLRLAA